MRLPDGQKRRQHQCKVEQGFVAARVDRRQRSDELDCVDRRLFVALFESIEQRLHDRRALVEALLRPNGELARSRALDAVRATQRQGRLASLSVEDAPDAALAAQDFASNPAGAVEAGERRSAVAEALGALPDPQRQAVELAFFEGLSQSEIAERLAVPLGTIKTRIRLAMTKLRQLLGPHGTEALV